MRTESAEGSSTLSQRDSALSQIEEGEGLLFRPRSEGYTIDYNIYAIKGADDFYLSLADIMEGLSFSVKVDQENQSASGWFLREDWPFLLDLKAGRLTARNQEFPVSPQDYKIEEGDIYIAGRAVEKWMGMTFDYDPSQQYLNIASEYPLPAVAQLKRRERKGNNPSLENIAQLPRKNFGYDMLNMSVADLAVRSTYNRSGSTGESSNSSQADMALSGELLKHSALLNVNADDTEGVNSISGRLFKESDEPNLLGPLKARSYSIGDTNTVDIPLTGDSSQELGARVSSNPLAGINYQDTKISGNALPGWDVELYRGNALLDTEIVDETGRYEFDNVQLYAGDNQFEVYFYGYQGEVKKETLSIPLTTDVLQAQGNTYDVSMTMNDSALYRRDSSSDEDEGTPHVAGRYNFYLGDGLAYAGFRGLQEQGEQKLYLGAGTTNIWNGFIFDTNLTVDEQGEGGARLGARKNIYDWNLASSVQLQSDRFTAGVDTTNPPVFQAQASAQRNYIPPIGTSGGLSLVGQYQEYADGTSNQTGAVGVSQGFNNVSFSNSVTYNQLQSDTGGSAKRVFNEFTGRARVSRDLTARAGISYRIKPNSQMDRYFANINYQPNSTFNLDADVEHFPDTRLTQAEVKANYTHERVRISPFLRVNNERDVAAGINLSAALVRIPQDTLPTITSDRIIGQGVISARVYLDVNGNEVFDEGDEPLPEVVVDSLNSRVREETDERGYALLKRLSVSLPTDVLVDNSSLPDPFMISINKGHSVLPRAGKVFEMNFPIQFAGEIDGTVAVADISGAQKIARSVTLNLLPLDPVRNKSVTAKAAQDGFYLLTPVAPGQYFLTASAQDAKALKGARPMPRLLTFTHEGTSFYAQDIVLQQGLQDIGFEVLAPGFFPEISGAEPEYFISVGSQKASGPLQAFYRMRMKNVVGQVIAGLQPIKVEGGDTYYRVGAGGLEAAYGRCQIMSVRKLPCQVSVLPVGSAPDIDAVPLTKQAAL